ncbi:MAG: hypothetical protein K2H70_00980, partial [Bacteroidales bacterium]|nr:hypothetical protein [Bacteroidales bacterium]
MTGGTALTQIPNDGSDVAAFVYNATAKEAVDDASHTLAGIPMGFDFKYGGSTYNTFAVAGYGYVILGQQPDITYSGNEWQMSKMMTYAGIPMIGIGTDAGVYGLQVNYKVDGTEGAKVLTVEFANIAYVGVDEVDKMEYQVKFFQDDNRIEMVFKGFNGITGKNFDTY